MNGIIAARTSVADKRCMVRTRTFSGVPPEDVLLALKQERFTGRVTLDLSQGGCSTVQAEDRTNMPHLTGGNNSG